MDTIGRLPQTGAPGLSLKRQLEDKLIEEGHYINTFGQDLPDVRNGTWGNVR